MSVMTEEEMDEQLDIIEDFWEEQERAEDEYDARQTEIEESYFQGARDFAEWWFNKPKATNPDFDKWIDVFIAEWKKGEECTK